MKVQLQGADFTVRESRWAKSHPSPPSADLCAYSCGDVYVPTEYVPNGRYSTVELTASGGGAVGQSQGQSKSQPKNSQPSLQEEAETDEANLTDKPLKNDWNEEFQALLSREDSAGKYLPLSRLARDFVYASKLYAKVRHEMTSDRRS